jgi:hypothetical protein
MKLLSTAHKDVFINTINNYMNNITFCSRNDLRTLPIDMPVVFRNFTANRKEIRIVQKTGRPWYYMDCGYFANITPRKSFMRIVPNDIQHSKPRYDLPADRFDDQCKIAELSGHGHPLRFSKWKKDGRAILIAPAANKSCTYYGYNLKDWLEATIAEIRKYTDRPIIVRDRSIRQFRIKENGIYHQFDRDNIFALVTYNSMAAVEAIGYGIPTFTSAPCAANEMCLQDLSKIETPYYPDSEQVLAWQHWLAYCHYLPQESVTNVPWELIEKYNLQ